MEGGLRHLSLVARTIVVAVEVGCTIRHGARPFTDDDGFFGFIVEGVGVAGEFAVLLWGHV